MTRPTYAEWRQYPTTIDGLYREPIWNRILEALIAFTYQTNPDGTPITSLGFWDLGLWNFATWAGPGSVPIGLWDDTHWDQATWSGLPAGIWNASTWNGAQWN